MSSNTVLRIRSQGQFLSALSPLAIPLAGEVGLAMPSRILSLQEGPAEAVPGAAETADAPWG